MRATELKKFKRILLERRSVLAGNLSSMATQVLKPSGAGDSADEVADLGSDQYEQDLTLGLMANEQGEISEIDDALERIDVGGFGKCGECEAPIPKPRLAALPFARYCIGCQSEKERMGEL